MIKTIGPPPKTTRNKTQACDVARLTHHNECEEDAFLFPYVVTMDGHAIPAWLCEQHRDYAMTLKGVSIERWSEVAV